MMAHHWTLIDCVVCADRCVVFIDNVKTICSDCWLWIDRCRWWVRGVKGGEA